MADMKHPGPWHLSRPLGPSDDIGGVLDANAESVFLANGVGEVSFGDQEAERLVLAAPESFALVVEMLCAVLPQLRHGESPPEFADFAARCRRLVTLVLAQPPKAQPVYPFPAKEAAQPADRPSYEELAATLKSTADELAAVERNELSRTEDSEELTAARALLARIEQEPHV